MIEVILQIGHLLGVALLVGGLAFSLYAMRPAQEALQSEADAFRDRLQGRARTLLLVAVATIFFTGLLKWTPESWGLGGVGWLGGNGKYTAILHGKLVLAILTLYLAAVSAFPGDRGRQLRLAKIALHMAILVMALAVIHNLRALG